MMRRLLIALLVIGMLAPLAACGRKGNLEPPPGSTYPRQYPTE
ncbi:MAG: lipoprotein [Rhodospirillales bacterium]|jgi:predicted small lipoprotein YifL|nr:lipoprotein [Rhodospirillales bacterium]